jgi:hypothetical protein
MFPQRAKLSWRVNSPGYEDLPIDTDLLIEPHAWTRFVQLLFKSHFGGGHNLYLGHAKAISTSAGFDFIVNQLNHNSMTCTELAQEIEKLQPNASPQDVARLCLLLTNTVDDLAILRDERMLKDAWKRTGLKLQVATDQHAAMTEELENLAASDPQAFTQDQIWILIRAIKVQSQVLQMYVGHALLDV